MKIKTVDGTIFEKEKYNLIGSVKKVRDRNIQKPPKIGQYPVFVEQFGSYKLMTFSSKLIES